LAHLYSMLAIARRWRYKWASGCSYVRDNRCVTNIRVYWEWAAQFGHYKLYY